MACYRLTGGRCEFKLCFRHIDQLEGPSVHPVDRHPVGIAVLLFVVSFWGERWRGPEVLVRGFVMSGARQLEMDKWVIIVPGGPAIPSTFQLGLGIPGA